MSVEPNNQIVLETSLQSYFYEELEKINSKSSNKLPLVTIFYSSLVLDKLSHSKEYFELVEGKVREKTLGLKLLESHHLPRKEMVRELKDIGDTSLMLCGFFPDSVNEKILDLKYYFDIGKIAYQKLNHLVPSFYDVDSFYNDLSLQFSTVTNLINIVQNQGAKDNDLAFILNEKVS